MVALQPRYAANFSPVHQRNKSTSKFLHRNISENEKIIEREASSVHTHERSQHFCQVKLGVGRMLLSYVTQQVDERE